MATFSFSFFLILFTTIGIFAAFKSKKSTQDYYLAGRNVPAVMVAFSAIATTYSGFMFTGLIGYTYKFGVAGAWLIGGWFLGEYITYFYTPKKVLTKSREKNILTYSHLLSRWNSIPMPKVEVLVSFMTIIFLCIYAAAQLSASNIALSVVFQWEEKWGGVLIAALIVLIYSFAGGVRASIWTDCIQLVVMIASMTLLVGICLYDVGGWSGMVTKLDTITTPAYLSFFAGRSLAGSALFGLFSFVLGFIIAGIGVSGQPHIVGRFMTMQDPNHQRLIRKLYLIIGGFIAFLSVVIGLLARAIFDESFIAGNFDPENSMPLLAVQYLPPIFVGFIISGLFSATMSTADSQILSCSSAFSQTFLPPKLKDSHLWAKLITLLLISLSVCIALWGGKGVFSLVVLAWGTLASAFTPLIILHFLGKEVRQNTALLMIVTGGFFAIYWRLGLGYNKFINECFIGILTGFLVYFGARRVRGKRGRGASGKNRSIWLIRKKR